MASQKDEIALQSKKSKIGVTILKEILKSIRLDPALIRQNNDILHQFLDKFITQMKYNDVLFKFLYNAPFFTGSFYCDLRVSKPDEFDINLILKLPFKDSDFEVTLQPQAPSYVKYRLKNPEEALAKYPLLINTLFENGYLIPEKVRIWIQSVVDKARNSNPQLVPGITLVPKAAGPARTILLKKENGGQIDVDLVPVIAYDIDLPKGNLDGRISAIFGSKLKAFLVPKPYYIKKRRRIVNNEAFFVPKPFSAVNKQMPINTKEARLLWRTHFPDAEGKIIHDLGCVKPVIKLLKLLRDREDWKILASYYLKTVVMWMIIENKNIKNEKDYWKEDKMDERFVDALKKLYSAVNEKKIPYLFNKKYNLLEKINPQQAENIKNRLNYWIRKIEDNRNNLWSAFHMKPLLGNL